MILDRTIFFHSHNDHNEQNELIKQKLEQTKKIKLDALIEVMKPLGFFDYVWLEQNSFCVISDSGTITEESSILNFAAITIRQAHERPEGMDQGTLIMSGLKTQNVLDAIQVVTAQQNDQKRTFGIIPDYDVENVSKKVLRIILSYIDYVNRTVWFKSL
jgi:UDP-N-acetylglucosamine 2-epimerase (non-hydrolysing)